MNGKAAGPREGSPLLFYLRDPLPSLKQFLPF
jgi:hypothetical protein